VKAPNSEQAAMAWLTWLREQGHTAAPAATSRPDPSGWYQTGFLVVATVGTAHDANTPGWRAPILSVDAWTYAPESGRPPYGHAAGLAQIVWDAAEGGLVPPLPLAVGTGYDRVQVQTVWPVTEIRRVPEPDGSSYAHYSIDIGLGWVRVPA
jgi:hypothetical protein